MLTRLMEGHPIGSATEFLNLRYSSIAADLFDYLGHINSFDRKVDDKKLVRMWLASNDARVYANIGDPAVRLSTA